jgi:hypothetical protein
MDNLTCSTINPPPHQLFIKHSLAQCFSIQQYHTLLPQPGTNMPKIKLKLENSIETAILIDHYSKLTLIRKNGFRKTYTDVDLFLCLAQIRQEFHNIKFLCKGAKINVFPSSMCSQMSNGAIAYEKTLGKKASFDSIVSIFDFDDQYITNDISEQRAFHRQWLKSFWDCD